MGMTELSLRSGLGTKLLYTLVGLRQPSSLLCSCVPQSMVLGKSSKSAISTVGAVTEGQEGVGAHRASGAHLS